MIDDRSISLDELRSALNDESVFAGIFEKFINPVEGWLGPREAYYLFCAAANCRNGVIVEIGAYRGRSTTALFLGSQLGNGIPVYSIDPHDHFIGPGKGVYGPEDRRAFFEQAIKSGFYSNVRLINLTSQQASEGWQEGVGLLWIDGDHNYQAVKNDVLCWSRFLTPDAIVVLDDVSIDFEGPPKVVDQLSACGWSAEFIGSVAAIRPPSVRRLPEGWTRGARQRLSRLDVHWTDPVTMPLTRRFDVAAKFMLARFWRDEIKSKWAERVYLTHLEIWNGFFEEYPPKKSPEDFLSAFAEIFKAVKNADFPGLASIIPISFDGVPLNGAHRIACALAFGKNVPVARIDIPSGNPCYDHAFFTDRASGNANVLDCLDAIAIEWTQLRPDSRVVVRFGVVDDDLIASAMISQNASVIYRKTLDLSRAEQINLVRELYDGENWLGSIENSFLGAASKAASCFGLSSKAVFYLVTPHSTDSLIEIKDRVRSYYGIGNHSIHITDDTWDTYRAATLVFSRSSLRFAAIKQDGNFANFNTLFAKFSSIVRDQHRLNDVVIHGSACLSVAGLRDCADIDYFHFGDDLVGPDGISSHNDQLKWHDIKIDDLIFDPKNFFYYRGIKFTNLNLVQLAKLRRNEPKDLIDVRLIDAAMIL